MEVEQDTNQKLDLALGECLLEAFGHMGIVPLPCALVHILLLLVWCFMSQSTDMVMLRWSVHLTTLFSRERSGSVLGSRPRGRGFEPHRRHWVVSLSKNINPSLVLVLPRKTCPFITERLLMGRKESNQTKSNTFFWASLTKWLSSISCTYFACNWQQPFLNQRKGGEWQ